MRAPTRRAATFRAPVERSRDAAVRSSTLASEQTRIIELRCPLSIRELLADHPTSVCARLFPCRDGECLCIAFEDEVAGADGKRNRAALYPANRSSGARREMPEHIGPYRIERRLGEGGMGVVYRACDPRLDRRVALKLLRRDITDEPRFRARLRREARAMAQLDHPAIVQIHDVLDTVAGKCIVMEHVEGRTLAQLIANEGPIAIDRVLRFGREIAEGLAAAHDHGLVHRDLKTENVMITADGRAKILDFGMAKQLRSNRDDASELTVDGTFVGTFRAMSPEQVNQQPIDYRSDLFSFGTLLYEALAGRNPFAACNVLTTMLRIATHLQRPLWTLDSAIPRELSDLVDHLLAKDPARRPRRALDVANALARIAAPRSSPCPAASPGSAARPRLLIGVARGDSDRGGSEGCYGPPT